ncbi:MULTISPECIES: GNAT family N-acetyltransferase [Streptomyces]|uniref:GNAT family N-acetyltransferase n=1 Tax=Streptomyces venezuelae TaxID=54571 RepID=A0A5P2BFX7_STRVZ|nr:GNAT family N-acetyltransferase [Streptomyces venezuelae]MYY86665.1 GNAT family N-acetyltransferase [Streptomyces sp. SID335]MYZ12750.1 GNAT family N-acetyltransferase [Streptomyces sp. SID337]NDZ91644.1 GNAT family N-acetyltransferase [Streptomyces sp. SID10115]NEA03252.1 GNAT family N-acetyltransferase [Streptomyces sp. SID10116]NEB45883.1 GNAT family N-acetyltransferase [Streptomyces sp. SID339]
MGVAIRRAGAADREDVIRLLDAALVHDPVSSWVFPDEGHRLRTHRALMGAFLDIALDEGYVDVTEDGAAVALWWSVPAGPHGGGGDGGATEAETEDGPALLRRAVDPGNERVEVIGRLTEAIHPADRAHEYLHLIAVHPDRQGEGLGTALVTAVLDRCDRDGLHAYLEASNARSRDLYARLGFAFMGTTLDLPDGPPMWPMWREPRA